MEQLVIKAKGYCYCGEFLVVVFLQASIKEWMEALGCRLSSDEQREENECALILGIALARNAEDDPLGPEFSRVSAVRATDAVTIRLKSQ